MTAKLGFRETILSTGIFGGVMFALVSVDPRVRERVTDLFGGGFTPFGDRVGDLGRALWDAAVSQSIDNAPLLVFATVGAVLTVFMLKS